MAIAQPNEELSSGRKNKWLVLLGSASIVSAVLVLASDLIGWAVVEKHNPITETISRLAVGEHAWIQDVGLDVYAAGIGALAIAMLLWSPGGWKWKAAAGALLVVAADIVVIAEYNQYAGFDGFGYQVHRWCCFVLYVSVAAAAGLLASELKPIDDTQKKATIAFLVVWLIGGPLFMFVVPTDIDGGVERIIGIALVAWTSGLAWMHVKAGRTSAAAND